MLSRRGSLLCAHLCTHTCVDLGHTLCFVCTGGPGGLLLCARSHAALSRGFLLEGVHVLGFSDGAELRCGRTATDRTWLSVSIPQQSSAVEYSYDSRLRPALSTPCSDRPLCYDPRRAPEPRRAPRTARRRKTEALASHKRVLQQLAHRARSHVRQHHDWAARSDWLGHILLTALRGDHFNQSALVFGRNGGGHAAKHVDVRLPKSSRKRASSRKTKVKGRRPR